MLLFVEKSLYRNGSTKEESEWIEKQLFENSIMFHVHPVLFICMHYMFGCYLFVVVIVVARPMPEVHLNIYATHVA